MPTAQTAGGSFPRFAENLLNQRGCFKTDAAIGIGRLEVEFPLNGVQLVLA
jgi:hypothetical protein